MLLPGATGAGTPIAEVEALRAVARGAVEWVLGLDLDVVVAVAGADATRGWPTTTPTGVQRHTGAATTTDEVLPAGLAVLLTLAPRPPGERPPVLQSVARTAAPDEAAALGRLLATSAARVGLLVAGDGSARRGPKAPGYFDERAHPLRRRRAAHAGRRRPRCPARPGPRAGRRPALRRARRLAGPRRGGAGASGARTPGPLRGSVRGRLLRRPVGAVSTGGAMGAVAAAEWFGRATTSADRWSAPELLVAKHDTRISVVIPARDEQATIGEIVTGIRTRADRGDGAGRRDRRHRLRLLRRHGGRRRSLRRHRACRPVDPARSRRPPRQGRGAVEVAVRGPRGPARVRRRRSDASGGRTSWSVCWDRC